MELLEKLTILSDAAKYDAACTSSGVKRSFQPGENRQHVLLHRRVLSQLFRRRAVHYAAEGADDQLLRL